MSGPRQFRQARKRSARKKRTRFVGATVLAYREDREAREVTLPMIIESEANGRSHWAAKARRVKRQRAEGFAIPQYLVCEPPCVVTLTRIAPRSLDTDNLQSGFKALRDGIADRLGVDDKDPRVRWEYQQERGEPRTYGARVKIESLEQVTYD